MMHARVSTACQIRQFTIDLQVVVDRHFVFALFGIGIRNTRGNLGWLFTRKVRVALVQENKDFAPGAEELDSLKYRQRRDFFRASQAEYLLIEFYRDGDCRTVANVS